MGVIKWTTDEVATLLELNAQGVYYREIGKRLGRSESAVEMKARALGIKRGSERIRRHKSNTLCWQCINATNSRVQLEQAVRPGRWMDGNRGFDTLLWARPQDLHCGCLPGV